MRKSFGIALVLLLGSLLVLGGGYAPGKVHASGTVIDVSTYGFDAEAVQDAHDALPSSGGELYFPAGSYVLESTVNITKPNVTLRGDGYQSKLFVKRTGAATFFTGMEVTGDEAQMRDLMLIGNGETDSYNVTLRWQSSQSLLENVWFERGGNRSLEIGFANEVMVRNNSFANTFAAGWGYGIVITNEAVDVVVRNNVFDKHRHAITFGVNTSITNDFSTPDNIYIVNNVIRQMPGGHPGSHRAGINIHPEPTGRAYILDNEIYNATEDGMEIMGMKGIIKNNYIHDNQRHGINIGADAVEWLVADNRVINSGQAGLLVVDYADTPEYDYDNNIKLDVLRSTFKNSAGLQDLYVTTANTQLYFGSMSSPQNYDDATSAALAAFGRSRFTSFTDGAVTVPDFGWPANKSTTLEFTVKDNRLTNGSLADYYRLQMLIDGEVVWEQDPMLNDQGWTTVSVDVIRQIAFKKEFDLTFRAKLLQPVSNFGLDANIDEIKLGGRIVNGGFEQTGDWTYSETASAYWSGARDSAVAAAGNYSYKLSFPDLQPAGGGQNAEITQTVKMYDPQVLKFRLKDDHTANLSYTDYYKSKVLVDGVEVWVSDPMTNGTAWQEYAVDIGRYMAWKPEVNVALRAELTGTVWNFGMGFYWDDVSLNDVAVPDGGFEQGDGWTYASSAGAYWTGARDSGEKYSGAYSYRLQFPDLQYAVPVQHAQISRMLQ